MFIAQAHHKARTYRSYRMQALAGALTLDHGGLVNCVPTSVQILYQTLSLSLSLSLYLTEPAPSPVRLICRFAFVCFSFVNARHVYIVLHRYGDLNRVVIGHEVYAQIK